MRTYEEAYAAAHDRRPFSNGTEGYAWTANWCDRCRYDRGTRDGSDPVGCPLLTVALLDRTPVEWIDQTEHGHRLGDTYHCTEFVPDDPDDGGDDGPEPEPGPPPVLEGQVDMFEVFAEQIVDRAADLAGVRS